MSKAKWKLTLPRAQATCIRMENNRETLSCATLQCEKGYEHVCEASGGKMSTASVAHTFSSLPEPPYLDHPALNLEPDWASKLVHKGPATRRVYPQTES